MWGKISFSKHKVDPCKSCSRSQTKKKKMNKHWKQLDGFSRCPGNVVYARTYLLSIGQAPSKISACRTCARTARPPAAPTAVWTWTAIRTRRRTPVTNTHGDYRQRYGKERPRSAVWTEPIPAPRPIFTWSVYVAVFLLCSSIGMADDMPNGTLCMTYNISNRKKLHQSPLRSGSISAGDEPSTASAADAAFSTSCFFDDLNLISCPGGCCGGCRLCPYRADRRPTMTDHLFWQWLLLHYY